jgi:hypothetical protein
MSKDILRDAPAGVQALMRELWRDIEKVSQEREEREAKADPVKHRLSKLMVGRLRYSYFEGKNGRGSRVRFCYSTNRNVAGYFLIWREVVTKRQVKRDQFDSAGSKDGAIRTARTMWERFKFDQLPDLSAVPPEE